MPSVTALWRYPIKAHGRETITAVTLTEGQTMPWDRRWAVAHELSEAEASGWSHCSGFSRAHDVASLMAIGAKSDIDAGQITLFHPERPDITFDPDKEPFAFLDWVRPLMPARRPQSVRIVRMDDHGITDTAYPSISLLNQGSNDEMAHAMKQDISIKRWRGNIVFSGLEAWREFDWVGQQIRIGTAVLDIKEPITRCMAPTANPDTGQRDANILGTLIDRFGHQEFGIYATVVESGHIKLGDSIEVV